MSSRLCLSRRHTTKQQQSLPHPCLRCRSTAVLHALTNIGSVCRAVAYVMAYQAMPTPSCPCTASQAMTYICKEPNTLASSWWTTGSSLPMCLTLLCHCMRYVGAKHHLLPGWPAVLQVACINLACLLQVTHSVDSCKPWCMCCLCASCKALLDMGHSGNPCILF